jgi:hypothetical protein
MSEILNEIWIVLGVMGLSGLVVFYS